MTDEEKRVDKEIQSHLKKVYGFSDDQLLKEVEKAEKSVNDLDFSGAEDRIYKRIMERRGEKEEERVKEVEPDRSATTLMSDKLAGSNESKVSGITGKNTDKEAIPAKKAVRFRKKTLLLVAAVAAILVMMLGSTAIGEKNYFLRRVGDGINNAVVVDNDKNKLDISKIEKAYIQIADELNIPILKLLYFPKEMKYEQLIFEESEATLVFDYDGNTIYYILKTNESEASIGIKSDAQREYSVHNDWLGQDITIRENILSNGETEYEAQIYIKNTLYCITGKMDRDEFDKMIENLYF